MPDALRFLPGRNFLNLSSETKDIATPVSTCISTGQFYIIVLHWHFHQLVMFCRWASQQPASQQGACTQQDQSPRETQLVFCHHHISFANKNLLFNILCQFFPCRIVLHFTIHSHQTIPCLSQMWYFNVNITHHNGLQHSTYIHEFQNHKPICNL